MKTKKIALIIVLSAFGAAAASAAEPQSAIRPEEQALRDRLSPGVEALLAEHCGEECPGFRIDPVFKKAAIDSLDDLGFSKPLAQESEPELRSVSLTVLVHERVTPGARESLKRVLVSRLGNLTGVPVSVKLSALGAQTPSFERRLRPAEEPALGTFGRIDLAKASVWPICMLILGGLVFAALLKTLAHRRDMQRERLAASRESAASGAQPVNGVENLLDVREEALRLLGRRAEDVQWLIEDAATRSDAETLKKVRALFSAEALSAKIRFSPSVLSALASLESHGADLKPSYKWLESALDRVHWLRLEEQANALAKFKRMSDATLSDRFSRLSSPVTQAAFLSAVSEERWPELLAALESERRVQVGLALSDYGLAAPADRAAVAARVVSELGAMPAGERNSAESTLQSYSLFLSEKEGQKLWQELSVRRAISPILSMEALLGDTLDPAAAAEICTRLDVGTLSVVLSQVSGETRARIYQGLPKVLQQRVSEPSEKRASEAEQMKARGRLMAAYRRFEAESSVQ